MDTNRTHTHRLFALVLAMLLLYGGVVTQVASSIMAAGDAGEIMIDAARRSP